MNNKFTPDFIEKLKAAKSVSGLLAIAKGNGVDMTQQDAEAFYAGLHQSGAIPDDELDRVSGGILRNTTIKTDLKRMTGVCSAREWHCPYCNSFTYLSDSDEFMITHHIQSEHPVKYSEYIGISFDERKKRFSEV